MMDEDDLRVFLERDYERVVRVLIGVCANRSEAEDVVCEALAKAWEKPPTVDYFDRWIIVVATNLARSRWRRVRREILSGLHSHDAARSDQEPERELRDLLGALPKRQRQAITLFYLGDLSIDQVAKALGVSHGAVKNALHSGRLALKAKLTGETGATNDELRLTP